MILWKHHVVYDRKAEEGLPLDHIELTYHDSLILVFIKHVRVVLLIPFSNTVFMSSCCVLVVKLQVFHAVVWGSNPGDDYFILLGRILRATIAQFRCPRSGTTLKPPKSVVYALRTNLLVVTHTNLQFFYSSCSNVQIFHSFENRFRHFVYRKLHVIYIFCVSSSLTAGGGFPAPSISDFL